MNDMIAAIFRGTKSLLSAVFINKTHDEGRRRPFPIQERDFIAFIRNQVSQFLVARAHAIPSFASNTRKIRVCTADTTFLSCCCFIHNAFTRLQSPLVLLPRHTLALWILCSSLSWRATSVSGVIPILLKRSSWI